MVYLHYTVTFSRIDRLTAVRGRRQFDSRAQATLRNAPRTIPLWLHHDVEAVNHAAMAAPRVSLFVTVICLHRQ